MAEENQLDSDIDDAPVDVEPAESDVEETHTVGDAASSLVAKEQERKRIQSDIEAFLAAGGQIQNVDSNVANDPPQKPDSSYGSQPI